MTHKEPDGKFKHFLSIPEGNDLALHEIISRYKLNSTLNVKSGSSTPPPQTTTAPTQSTQPKSGPGGLSERRAGSAHLPFNHGAVDSAGSRRLLRTASPGGWLLRFSTSQQQTVVTHKGLGGKFEHVLSIVDGKDLSLPEIISRYQLDAKLIVKRAARPMSRRSRNRRNNRNPRLRKAPVRRPT